MILNTDKHEVDKIREYQNMGYMASYRLKAGKLQDLETKKSYNSDEIEIDDEYRYEGYSNPSDMSILYVLRMKDGSKGTLLLAYGPSSDTDLAWFMKEVSINNKDKTKLKKVIKK